MASTYSAPEPDDSSEEDHQPVADTVASAERDGEKAPQPIVVGIGASAGGLAALKTFFSRVPRDSGLAFVVVMHLAPDHESHLAELLQPHVPVTVRQVTETTPLEANGVYVIPPNRNLDTIDTHLRLTELEGARDERAPIDHFFRALARTHDGRAIGVVLTGTGSDGTLGVKEIKGCGGLTIAQDPAEAEYDGMPQSAVATGLVDLILPLDEIPEAILRYSRVEPRVPRLPHNHEAESEGWHYLQKIFGLLRSRTGRDFSHYKHSTILRRIQRRMQLSFIEELGDYLRLLREERDESIALADDLLITVTNFFRDPEVFEALEEAVLPQLLENKGAGDVVRVWSVGCATGEEAYSLAILLTEATASVLETGPAPRIQIFASDLHEGSLAIARDGFYPGDIAADVSDERLARFFHKEDGGYRVRKDIRELVVFAPHNLLADPPFSRLDLIVCRNLLIYLQRDVQRDIIELFHYALNPGGTLVLGTSETVDGSEFFQSEERHISIYSRRSVPAPEPRLPVFPLMQSRVPSGFPSRGRSQALAADPVAYGVLHHQMVERVAPPSLLLNPDDKVVHLSERAGRYLSHPGGELTASITKLVREELRSELRADLLAVREHGEPRRTRPIQFQVDGEVRLVTLDLRPAEERRLEGFVLVIFDERAVPDGSPSGASASQGDEPLDEGSERLRDLATQLTIARERLRSVMEEQDASQEELRASNEELQSANEELRSTLEELETSKEELQSMNEELQTVNQENRHKMEELAQLTSDLQNLMAATEIATLFLDRQLRILRFTPRIGDLFNVRPADRGRPLSDLTHRLGYASLIDDAKRVLDNLVPVEREVEDDAGRWYLTRVLPYRSSDERIEGVVITFVDITTRVIVESALRESEEQFRALVDASAQMVWTADEQGHVVEDSPSWRAFTGQTEAERAGRGWLDAVHPDDRDSTRADWQEAVAGATPFVGEFRLRHAPTDSHRWTSVRAVPLTHADGTMRGWVGMNTDCNERKQAVAALIYSKENLEARVEERTAQVRKLASTLTMAEHDERRRIAQILHDDLQQLLFGVQLKMTLVRQSAETDDVSALTEHTRESEDFIGRALRVTRQLTVDLSPPVLAGEGLADALAWLATQMKEVHDLTIEIEAEQPFVIEQEGMRVLLFQIVRELLFNVVKHADVLDAKVSLKSEDDTLIITVSDHGAGFDPDAVTATVPEGFGLFSVRERLRLFSGHLDIDSAPGEGTRIVATIPEIIVFPD